MSVHSKSATSVSDAPLFDAPEPPHGSGEGQASPVDDESIERMPGLMARNRISRLTRRTKTKTKIFFKFDAATANEPSADEDADPLDNIKTNPAFSSSRVVKKSRFGPGKAADKTLGALQSIGNAIVHPVEAVKSTATRTTAGQLSKAERPFLSQKADIEYLQAHDGGDDNQSWYTACSLTSIIEDSDIRSFRCQSYEVNGRLFVFSKGIRFLRSFPKKEIWRWNYLELAEMRKTEGSTVSKIASLSPDQLEIKCIDGSKLHLDGMQERDEAFNTIIGFSSLQGQSLQILSNTNAQP